MRPNLEEIERRLASEAMEDDDTGPILEAVPWLIAKSRATDELLLAMKDAMGSAAACMWELHEAQLKRVGAAVAKLRDLDK